MPRPAKLLKATVAIVAVMAAAMGRSQPSSPFTARLKALEQASGGRLGVAIIDSATNKGFGYRTDEKFPMCSTFKLLLVGAVLQKVDRQAEQLGRQVQISKGDLMEYSPATAKWVGKGMSVEALCEAALTLSDNTAANLLLARIGGPNGITAFARKIGDDKTRLDRTEPTLNEARPGEPRDTSTPGAMLHDLYQLTVGNVLTKASKTKLITWLTHNKTGNDRMRAGLPRDWQIGDKTGTGERGTANDVAIVWPTRHAPILIAVFLTGSRQSRKAQNETIAAVARLVKPKP